MKEASLPVSRLDFGALDRVEASGSMRSAKGAVEEPCTSFCYFETVEIVACSLLLNKLAVRIADISKLLPGFHEYNSDMQYKVRAVFLQWVLA